MTENFVQYQWTKGQANWHTDYNNALAAIEAAVNAVLGNSATSSTSNTVGAGAKTWTLDGATNPFRVGQVLRASRAADSGTWLQGSVASISGQDVAVTVTQTSGSGTYTDWLLSPPLGVNGVPAPADAADDNKVLTASGGDFSWQPAPSGLALLSTSTVSTAVASVDITGIASTYDEYEIHFIDVVPETGALGKLCCRLSTDGGSTFASGASDYEYAGIGARSGSTGSYVMQSGGADNIPAYADNGGAQTIGALDGLSGVVRISRHADSTTATAVMVDVHQIRFNGTLVARGALAGSYMTAAATNAIRFLFIDSADNIASGTFRLYGVRKS